MSIAHQLYTLPFIGDILYEWIGIITAICISTFIGIACFYFYLGYALINLEGWARTATMALTVVSIFVAFSFIFLIPAFGCLSFIFILILGIIIFWYLSKYEIKELFQEKYDETENDEDSKHKRIIRKVSIPDKIKKLKELRDDDIISDEDFETKKQELLEKY